MGDVASDESLVGAVTSDLGLAEEKRLVGAMTNDLDEAGGGRG